MSGQTPAAVSGHQRRRGGRNAVDAESALGAGLVVMDPGVLFASARQDGREALRHGVPWNRLPVEIPAHLGVDAQQRRLQDGALDTGGAGLLQPRQESARVHLRRMDLGRRDRQFGDGWLERAQRRNGVGCGGHIGGTIQHRLHGGGVGIIQRSHGDGFGHEIDHQRRGAPRRRLDGVGSALACQPPPQPHLCPHGFIPHPRPEEEPPGGAAQVQGGNAQIDGPLRWSPSISVKGANQARRA